MSRFFSLICGFIHITKFWAYDSLSKNIWGTGSWEGCGENCYPILIRASSCLSVKWNYFFFCCFFRQQDASITSTFTPTNTIFSVSTGKHLLNVRNPLSNTSILMKKCSAHLMWNNLQLKIQSSSCSWSSIISKGNSIWIVNKFIQHQKNNKMSPKVCRFHLKYPCQWL